MLNAKALRGKGAKKVMQERVLVEDLTGGTKDLIMVRVGMRLWGMR
jgi:hypothetical protein